MCKRRYPVILALVTFAILSAQFAPPPAYGWQFIANGEGNSFDQGLAVAFDRDHVIAAGRLGDDIFAIKVNRKHGHEIWRFQLPGDGPGAGMVRAVAVDPKGHVILGGVGPGSFTLIKLDKETGIPHWIAKIGAGDAFGVAVDAIGDVLAAGVLDNEIGIVKLRGTDGAELWRAKPSGGGGRGQARAFAIDQAGNGVAAGWTRQENGDIAFAVVKVAGLDGSEQWRQLISDSTLGFDQAVAVAVDAAGDVVALGVVQVFTGTRLTNPFTAVKLAGSDGAIRWRRDVSGDSNGVARAVALDAASDVIAAGVIAGQSGVVKLAGVDGTELWRSLGSDLMAAVAVDAAGNVAAAGAVFVGGPQRFDMVVQKLSGATGSPAWRQVLSGAGSGDDLARAVAFDDQGDVVMVGELYSDATGADFGVVKLSGFDGSDF